MNEGLYRQDKKAGLEHSHAGGNTGSGADGLARTHVVTLLGYLMTRREDDGCGGDGSTRLENTVQTRMKEIVRHRQRNLLRRSQNDKIIKRVVADATESLQRASKVANKGTDKFENTCISADDVVVGGDSMLQVFSQGDEGISGTELPSVKRPLLEITGADFPRIKRTRVELARCNNMSHVLGYSNVATINKYNQIIGEKIRMKNSVKKSINGDIPVASQLLGLSIESGWIIINRSKSVQRKNLKKLRSHCYIVSKNQELRFLKAIDYASLFRLEGKEIVHEPHKFSVAFKNEKLVNRICSDDNMSKVTKCFENGEICLPNHASENEKVRYLLFEKAERDLDKLMATKQIDPVTQMVALRDAFEGIWQLHNSNIAHQDLKPANILDFGSNSFKVCDLGRSTIKDKPFYNKKCLRLGSKTISPPEILYEPKSDFIDYSFEVRRFGVDYFSLGSLTAFLFAGTDVNSLLYDAIGDDYHYSSKKRNYQEVLVILKRRFSRVIDELYENLPIETKDFFIKLIQEFCEPDFCERARKFQQFDKRFLKYYIKGINKLIENA